MGYYIAANETRKSYAARNTIQLDTAINTYIHWDVFVSHKSNDTARAVQIAERISRNGLSAWVDVADPIIARDGPELADYIRRVLKSSRSLLALVTSATKESWWVPFEIGLAFEQQRLLASYGNRASLPSFLYKWPNVQDDTQLDHWCEELRRLAKHTAYATRMRALATRF